MKTKISLLIGGLLLCVAAAATAQDTLFYSGFSYDDPSFIIEPADLNGADDQVGEWSGDEFPEGIGDILEAVAIFVAVAYLLRMRPCRGKGCGCKTDIRGLLYSGFHGISL